MKATRKARAFQRIYDEFGNPAGVVEVPCEDTNPHFGEDVGAVSEDWGAPRERNHEVVRAQAAGRRVKSKSSRRAA
ncbi:hypothetical protein PLCT1_01296 [Planctomycetaceae bacterium]|nr:hypothetical protein PLCT1_01296 [Planctomycetaceae bacterium]